MKYTIQTKSLRSRMMQTARSFCTGAETLFCLLLIGCASIPERDLENGYAYQRRAPSRLTASSPVSSQFHELAVRAEETREAGGTQEYALMLERGDDALLARIHLIRAARSSIDLQTFIWKNDPTSRFIFDELVKAAERGVFVRVLIDAFMMPGTPDELARMAARHRNLQICLYKPLDENAVVGRIGFWDRLLFKTRHMNRRMHNKLLLIDESIGIAGGRNYEGKYYDRDAGFLFRDRDVLIAGPAVQDMQLSFELFWQDKSAVFVTQLKDVRAAYDKLNADSTTFSDPADAGMFEEIDRLANAHSIVSHRKGLRIYEVDQVQFVADSPRKFDGRKEPMDFDEWFEELLSRAERRLVYQTPYLIYSRGVRREFRKLRKDHPKFRIIASSNSLAAADHLHVYALSFKHRKELYKKTGIDIYEAKPYPADQDQFVYGLKKLQQQALEQVDEGKKSADALHRAGPRLCIHAKSFVLDGTMALIGSHNFDPRSSNLNTECGVFIRDEEFAADLEARILKACQPQNAWTVSKGPTTPVISYFSGFIGAVSTALPIFDVWPYRYTTNYEMKEGSFPVPPRHPAFQEHYVDVGYFPEVSDSSTLIQTRLIKAFFGWARPFM